MITSNTIKYRLQRLTKVILGLFLLLFLAEGKAQDFPISQYYNNLVHLNPAYVGTSGGARANAFYRNQWLRSNAGFQYFGATYDRVLPQYNSGIGIMASSDISGVFMSPSVDIMYAYHVKLASNFHISMGMQAGIVQKYISTSSLVFDDGPYGSSGEQIVPGFNKIFPDFALGIISFYNNIYTGFSVDHIAKPMMGTTGGFGTRINRRYVGHFGYIYNLPTRLMAQTRIISPNILVELQGSQTNITWGGSFQFEQLVGGAWVRHNIQPNFDALILSLGFITQDLKFAYSYDVNIGKRTSIPLGAHEVSITKLFEVENKKKQKPIKCPTFLR